MLNEQIQQFWQDNADSFLKTLLIHMQSYDQQHIGELNDEQQSQLQQIIGYIHHTQYSSDKAQAYLELANGLPLIVMYYLLKSTQQENGEFIETLLSYVFEQESEHTLLFKAKNIDLEKAQLLVRYLSCDPVNQLEQILK